MAIRQVQNDGRLKRTRHKKQKGYVTTAAVEADAFLGGVWEVVVIAAAAAADDGASDSVDMLENVVESGAG